MIPHASSPARPAAAPAQGLAAYAAAFLLVALTTALGMVLQSRWGNSPVDMLYLLPVMAAASYAGLGPGLSAAVASALGRGFVPIRKPGKLPAERIGRDYQLEYGSDRVEVHIDAIARDERVLLVDDLIATGGTALAAATLIETLGGKVVECAFVIDLPALGGRKRLSAGGFGSIALCAFDGE